MCACVLYTISVCICVETTLLLLKKNRKQKVKAPYKCVIWYMELPSPTLEQSGLISIVVGAGAAWFGLYTGSSKKIK